MTRRYYVPDLPEQGGRVALPTAEARHATHVMRVQPGDAVALFDGKGNEATAVISQVGRTDCQCDAETPIAIDREPARTVHLGIALPKPDRARELIERLTELGVKSVTPIMSQRTQRPPSHSLIEKLRRAVVEACKQSGRNQLMELMPTQTTSDYFATHQNGVRWIAHPYGAMRLTELPTQSDHVEAAIGPEGGWTDQEFELAQSQGFEPVLLGERIYRVETAAIVTATILTVLP